MPVCPETASTKHHAEVVCFNIHISTFRAAFRILLKGGGGGGGKIAVSTYQEGQALHAVHYNYIYSKILGEGGANIQQGGTDAPLRPPLKCNPDIYK